MGIAVGMGVGELSATGVFVEIGFAFPTAADIIARCTVYILDPGVVPTVGTAVGLPVGCGVNVGGNVGVVGTGV